MGLYVDRKMWAEAFIMNTYFRATCTTSRCEGIHSFLDKHVSRKLPFNVFVQWFETSLSNICNKEGEFDQKSRYGIIIWTHPFKGWEQDAARVYTRKSLHIFQEQLIQVVAYIDYVAPIREGCEITYFVKWYNRDCRFRMVTYVTEDESLTCSYHLFESTDSLVDIFCVL